MGGVYLYGKVSLSHYRLGLSKKLAPLDHGYHGCKASKFRGSLVCFKSGYQLDEGQIWVRANSSVEVGSLLGISLDNLSENGCFVQYQVC